ncbi:hypothetical protein JB92DRAFT_49616 [Gautieria morchelliformis]|nr:hypothetical protein JB92DRAFT_49616 [Gautieria morchelliformis]
MPKYLFSSLWYLPLLPTSHPITLDTSLPSLALLPHDHQVTMASPPSQDRPPRQANTVSYKFSVQPLFSCPLFLHWPFSHMTVGDDGHAWRKTAVTPLAYRKAN